MSGGELATFLTYFIALQPEGGRGMTTKHRKGLSHLLKILKQVTQSKYFISGSDFLIISWAPKGFIRSNELAN